MKRLLLAVALPIALAIPRAAVAQIPATFTNLQVLPSTVNRAELTASMRDFATGLGVRCNHCHVGENAATLENFDFASDAKEAKRVARVMMKMTRDLNERALPQTGRPKTVGVGCVTCHRGLAIPRTLLDVLIGTADRDGVEAALKQYRTLREQSYGKGTYDFSEITLSAFAEHLDSRHNTAGAIAVLEQAVGLYPTNEFLKKRLEALRPPLDFAPQVAGKTAAEVNKNIQVLKTLPAVELFPAMQFMAASLGVGCEHCHVTDNTGRWPMEKDDKPQKTTARRMLTMVQTINETQFGGRNAITCATCHHGSPRPTAQPPLFDPAAPPRMVFAAASKEPMPTVAAVLEKFVAAIGGREANAAVTSRLWRGTVTPAGARPSAFEVLEAAPDKLRATITGAQGKTVQGVDGSAVWTLDPQFGVHGETGLEALRMIRLADFHKNEKLGDLNPTLEVLGAQEIGGRRTVVLVGTLPSQQIERLYFDAESGLLARRLVLSPTPLGFTSEQVDWEDYRTVERVKLPFLVRRTGATFSNTQRYDEIRLNVPVDPATFKKPQG